MWNDQPIKRPQESNDLPPSSRAYYSPFVHSFTPPALINDPYAVEKKLTITPLLLGPSRHKIFRRDEKFDPALERVRYYVGSEALKDEEVEASLALQAIEHDEWCDADVDEYVDVCMEQETKDIAINTEPKKKLSKFVVDVSSKTVAGHKEGQKLYGPRSENCSKNPTTPTKSPQTNKPRFESFDNFTSENVETESQRSSTPLSSPVYRFSTTSPTQSETTTVTSWDEWDEPVGMMAPITPISVASIRSFSESLI